MQVFRYENLRPEWCKILPSTEGFSRPLIKYCFLPAKLFFCMGFKINSFSYAAVSLVETYEHYADTIGINRQLINQRMTEARLFDDSKHLDLIYKLFGFDRIMTEKELLLVFRDEMTNETVNDLLAIAEIKMKSVSGEKKFIRRVFNILVECVQNIVNHADVSPVRKLNQAAILVIGKGVDHYFVITGNLIRNERIENLKEIIDLINGLSPEVIRDYYTEKMKVAEFSAKGGAGLGLLDISRRSGRKLEYDFRQVDDVFSYFSFKINVAFELPGVETEKVLNKKS